LVNKLIWYIALANAFIYLVRYGVLDWAPTYLKEAKGFSLSETGWAYFLYEWAGIPGTLICGWLSDKVFGGRRAPATIIYMLLVTVAVFVYWKNPAGNPLVDNVALIAIGFLIYGPVMLIGVHALDLVPKKAAGTAAGLTGLFGYLGGAVFANAAMGYVVDAYGWDGGFYVLLAACVLSVVFTGLTWKKEKSSSILS
jgi:OPA family glycerol-3-phosphate transporter-like MFS transporter